jgi:general stress protein 26
MAKETTKEKLDRFYDLIDHIETAMFTTRRSDGYLVSRPMATQTRAEGADLWFATDKNSPKIREIKADSHVNVAYFDNKSKEWISCSGTAKVVRDRAKIKELYSPDWKAWFGDDGGENDGGPDDPRIVLIAVRIRFAVYLEVNKPKPVILFELVKGLVTGNRPDMGTEKTIRGKDLRPAAKKK